MLMRDMNLMNGFGLVVEIKNMFISEGGGKLLRRLPLQVLWDTSSVLPRDPWFTRVSLQLNGGG